MKKTILGLLLFSTTVFAQQHEISVSDVGAFAINAGETQSTVVAPGKCRACEKGRIFITNDLARPNQFETIKLGSMPNDKIKVNNITRMVPIVYYKDLDKLDNVAMQTSNFEWGKGGIDTNYTFGTNDHDLISLSNGDILYMTGAFSKKPLSPKPGWFDFTFRGTFGPGARSVVLVWKSVDCGKTFQLISEMDPALQGDGICACPQTRKDANKVPIYTKPYDMGGTDGQLAKVDPKNDYIYLMFACVGNIASPNLSPWTISTVPIKKNMVMVSDDKGKTWKQMGYIEGDWHQFWRGGIVPFSNDEVAFTFGSKLGLKKNNNLKLENITGKEIIDTETAWGWGSEGANLKAGEFIGSNMWANTVSARAGNTKNTVLISFPTEVKKADKEQHGYRLFVYNTAENSLGELPEILPENANNQSIIFHLALVDLGVGPVMAYWYDINGEDFSVTIKGRFIYSENESSDDFVISKIKGEKNTFSLTAAKRYWYGDYHTASGYAVTSTTLGAQSFHYYPIWVQPDGTVKYAEVKLYISNKINPGVINQPIAVKPLFKKDILLPNKQVLRARVPHQHKWSALPADEELSRQLEAYKAKKRAERAAAVGRQ